MNQLSVDLPSVDKTPADVYSRVVSSFNSRNYFSGADVRFEFDDILVEDIAGITYKLIEPIKFHYGWASRTRVKVSRGQRLVQGQIITNFQDASQMYTLLQKIKNKNSPPAQHINPKTRQEVFNALAGGNVSSTAAKALLGVKGTNGLSRLNTADGRPDPNAVRAFRDAVWGAGGNSPLYLDPEQEKVTPRLGSTPLGFDIRMIFGEPDYTSSSTDQATRLTGAVILLSGVELMSEAIEITETGEPLRLAYEFMAADVNAG